MTAKKLTFRAAIMLGFDKHKVAKQYKTFFNNDKTVEQFEPLFIAAMKEIEKKKKQ